MFPPYETQDMLFRRHLHIFCLHIFVLLLFWLIIDCENLYLSELLKDCLLFPTENLLQVRVGISYCLEYWYR